MDVLTTYLTRTSGGADGNNGEYGQNSSQKGTNNAQKQLNVDIKIFGLRLGPGEFAGSNPVTSTKQYKSEP